MFIIDVNWIFGGIIKYTRFGQCYSNLIRLADKIHAWLTLKPFLRTKIYTNENVLWLENLEKVFSL